MRLAILESTDGDRAWIVVNGVKVGFVRTVTLAQLVADFERPYGPQELIPVVARGEDRRQQDRRTA